MRFMIAAALAVFLAAPAAAQEGDKEKPAKKEKRICRTGEPTGSRLVVRTCRTQAEWDVIDREQAAAAEQEIDRQQTMSRGGGSGFSPN